MNRKLMYLMIISCAVSVVSTIAYLTVIRKIYVKISFVVLVVDCIMLYIAFNLGKRSK